jgi:hypothetical protein
MLHFILDLEGKNSIHLPPGRALLHGVVTWAIFGALVALLTIVLTAVTAEQQVPGFYAALFVTLVVSMALCGAFCTICSIRLSRFDSKRPRTEAA